MRSGIVSSGTKIFGKIIVANLDLVCYVNSLRAISTVVAHFLHTEGVTGSNPVLPIQKPAIADRGFFVFKFGDKRVNKACGCDLTMQGKLEYKILN